MKGFSEELVIKRTRRVLGGGHPCLSVLLTNQIYFSDIFLALSLIVLIYRAMIHLAILGKAYSSVWLGGEHLN
jgi:hypothetical protein